MNDKVTFIEMDLFGLKSPKSTGGRMESENAWPDIGKAKAVIQG